MRLGVLALATAVALAGTGVFAAGTSTSHSHSGTPSATGSRVSGTARSPVGSHGKAAPEVRRDSHGRIARDPRQTNVFRKLNPCPSTGKTSGSCPGYVIDHVVPLKRGGEDSPSNMQWQTRGAAKQKDRWE